ncbi:hypothetical protein JRQ81_002687, partial [Phrynocephalus forsythii]
MEKLQCWLLSKPDLTQRQAIDEAQVTEMASHSTQKIHDDISDSESSTSKDDE